MKRSVAGNRPNEQNKQREQQGQFGQSGQRRQIAILMLGVSALGLALLMGGCKNGDFGTSGNRNTSETNDEALPVFESSAAGSDNYNRVTEIEPAAVSEPIFEPVSTAPVVPTTHKVARGDTLWSIARRYYDDGKRWRDIAEANHIENPRQLTVGDTLTLP